MRLRQAQASAALNRAIALRPDLGEAHFHLHQLYHKMGYLDLALKHLQIYLRLAREAGASRGEEYAKYQERAKQLAQELQQRASAVTLSAEDSPPRERAIQAFQRGLAGKALDVLLESDVSAFGNEGMDLELELLLGVGRANDVYKWLTSEYGNALGPLEYHWFRVRALAANGDYTRAEEECDEASRALVRAPEGLQPVSLREKAALWIANYVLTGSVHEIASFGTLFFSRIDREMLHKPIEDSIQLLRQQADLTVLHGLLALEEGETGEAESAFRAALALRKGQSVDAWDSGWEFNSRGLAQECLRWLK
jgi:tetratricopeptide (TPR) repeat protein